MILDNDEEVVQAVNGQNTLKVIYSVRRHRTLLWKELRKRSYGTIRICFVVCNGKYKHSAEYYLYAVIHVPTQIRYDRNLKKRENLDNWTSIITESINNLLERTQASYVRMEYVNIS